MSLILFTLSGLCYSSVNMHFGKLGYIGLGLDCVFILVKDWTKDILLLVFTQRGSVPLLRISDLYILYSPSHLDF